MNIRLNDVFKISLVFFRQDSPFRQDDRIRFSDADDISRLGFLNTVHFIPRCRCGFIGSQVRKGDAFVLNGVELVNFRSQYPRA